MYFFSYGKRKINLVEIKRGFARGGHYHEYDSDHVIISGKIEVRLGNLETGKENIQIMSFPSVIHIPKNIAHIFLALEDSLFMEISDEEYITINYPKYRKF